jgi:hypothetical protein
MRHFKKLAGVLIVVATSVSCGDVARQGKAPTYLIIDLLTATRGAASAGEPSGFLLSDVITLVTSPAPCTPTEPCATIFDDVGTVTLRLAPKDIGTTTSPSTLTSNNEVTINRYRVRYIRSDGRNQEGVDVPFAFDGAVTGTVPAQGTIQLSFEVVRHIAKKEAPLVQLRTSPTIISTIAEITFFGRDVVGNEVSAIGTLTVDFGNFGDI